MIFSRQYDFLFIKGRKVAGTSVEIALSTVCGPDDIITPITPIDELERLRRGGRGAQNYSVDRNEERNYLERLAQAGADAVTKKHSRSQLYASHMSLQDFVDRFGSLPTRRDFCVERSPYSKVISKAVMAANFTKYKRKGKSMSLAPEQIPVVVAAYMQREAAFEICRNVELYRGADTKVSVRALRQEFLFDDFAALMKDYNISPVPELPHAKQGINSNQLDPKSVFTRDQLNTINDFFSEEFDTFGYERV
jgi:hypothetical protein